MCALGAQVAVQGRDSRAARRGIGSGNLPRASAASNSAATAASVSSARAARSSARFPHPPARTARWPGAAGGVLPSRQRAPAGQRPAQGRTQLVVEDDLLRAVGSAPLLGTTDGVPRYAILGVDHQHRCRLLVPQQASVEEAARMSPARLAARHEPLHGGGLGLKLLHPGRAAPPRIPIVHRGEGQRSRKRSTHGIPMSSRYQASTS